MRSAALLAKSNIPPTSVSKSPPLICRGCLPPPARVYSLIADPENIDPRDQVAVSAVGAGPDELLHAWLRELLSQFNLDGFVGKTCVVERLTDDRIDGIVHGETLDLSRHRFRTEIKGVTYHDFKIWQENGAWHARVIFDV